ncbi:MAG: Ku protein [Candidatus Melainabacteria bacterium]|nr:Ku protein [Candidatus Melainabacteria bacterium]
MARAIWKGIITFGMVSMPVKLYSATSSKNVSLHLVHNKCDSRIKEQRFCPTCEEVVDYADLVRGYEYSKSEFVEVTNEDFEQLPLATKHTVEISDFVKLEEIDPIYYDKAYHVEPDPAAKKPFALFMKAVKDKDVLAVGKVALRSKERLCVLRPVEGLLVLNTLLYPDEISVDMQTPLPKVSVSDKELDMAEKLIDMMTGPFEPEKYHDEYREALLKLIEAKVEGKQIKPVSEKGKKGEVIDLFDALKASMEKYEGQGKAKATSKKADSDNSEGEEEESKPKAKTAAAKKKAATREKATSAARTSSAGKVGTTKKKRTTAAASKKQKAS